MDKKGVTLIELLVVIAIIGILAMIGIPMYIGQQKSATRNEAYTNLQNLRLLEEQFMAENGAYTPALGTAGKDNDNITIIQTGNGTPANGLPGFKPGSGLSYSYSIVGGKQITDPTTKPPTTANIAAGAAPCFVAYAYGNSGSRVDGDVFAIDCNNNRNF
jgi:prepilin-type N-terminal cleavage/methylation domain-containing protein